MGTSSFFFSTTTGASSPSRALSTYHSPSPTTIKNLLVTASWDRTIRRWDAVRGQQKSEPLSGHTDSILSISLSPDGRVLASSSYDKTIRLWDIESWNELNGGEPLLGHEGKVWCVAFHPIQDEQEPSILASCSEDETVRFWRVTSGASSVSSDTTTSNQQNQQNQNETIKVHLKRPKEQNFARADKDEDLMLKMKKNEESDEKFFQTLRLGSPVNYIAWSPNGSILACALQNDLVRLFSVGVGEILIPSTTCRASFHRICFGPKGRLVEFEDICGKKKAFDLLAVEKENLSAAKKKKEEEEKEAATNDNHNLHDGQDGGVKVEEIQ